MEFGSKYVYAYNKSDEEDVSEEEFECGLDSSESARRRYVGYIIEMKSDFIDIIVITRRHIGGIRK